VTVDGVLRGLLEAEHAAIYAYGVLGARLPASTRLLAQHAFDAHRSARDRLMPLAPGVVLSAAYDVRTPTVPSALALAIQIEDDFAVRWHDLVAVTTDPLLRRLGVQGLQDAAVRACQWRRAAGTSPFTKAFPGQS
jgi:hypothetical protein